jgi:lysozyme
MVAIADMPRGMDVSKFQGDIEWPSAKASGISFAFARAIDDHSPGDKADPKFASNFANMKDAGVFRGAYYFLRPARKREC